MMQEHGGTERDEKLIPSLPIRGEIQIVLLGLLIAAILLFGDTIADFFS